MCQHLTFFLQNKHMSERGKLLVADAEGRLYLVPLSDLEPFEVKEPVARSLIDTDSRSAQEAELVRLGGLTQVRARDLPNFRLLMQLEYEQPFPN